jgi:hypothetical protein
MGFLGDLMMIGGTYKEMSWGFYGIDVMVIDGTYFRYKEIPW